MSTSNSTAVVVASARQSSGASAPRRGIAMWLLSCVAFVAACSASASPTAPAAPTRWVTDSAGFLSPAMRDALDQRLQAYQVRSGHELLVWIAPTVAKTTIDEFAVRAFAAWQVGRKGLDDGLVLFIFASDRKLRIEVGYGLEGVVTDAQASRIINDVMGPPLRAVQPDAAVEAGVTALMTLIAPEATETTAATKDPLAPVGTVSPSRNTPTKPAPPLSIWWIIFGSIGGLAFIAFALTHPRIAMLLVANVFARGFGAGGGGGRLGGGGRSGGGGASGGW